MIPTSSKDILRVPIEGTDIVYLVRPSKQRERAAFNRDLRAEGAVMYSEQQMFAAIRAGIRRSVAEDQRLELLGIVDDFAYNRKRQEEGAEELNEELAQKALEIETFLRRHDREYSGIEADRAYWLELAPVFAFQRFVVGWENLDVTPERMGGQLTDACMEQIPREHIDLVGWEAIILMSPGKVERKNSLSQSPSAENLTPSTAEDFPQTADQAG